jgi:hypothetical protein
MTTLPWLQHLIVVPVLLPLLVGALLIPVNQNRHTLKFAMSLTSGVLLWLVAVALLLMADGGHWAGRHRRVSGLELGGALRHRADGRPPGRADAGAHRHHRARRAGVLGAALGPGRGELSTRCSSSC